MTLEVRLDKTGTGMTRDQIDAYLEASKGGFTVDQIKTAFDAVKDSTNWKNPIDAVIDRNQMAVTGVSIPYYTGTKAMFEDVSGMPDKVRVLAAGYYMGPCN